MTYTEAVNALKSSGESFDYPIDWGLDLQSEHERYLTERKVGKPVIVTDYPSSIKAFYMRLSDDGRTVRAMDVLVPRIGEIIGGSQREERLDILQSRMAESGLDAAPYWWYLDLRRYGTAPHAGFGLGFERTVQFATGMQNIRDVSPSPHPPQRRILTTPASPGPSPSPLMGEGWSCPVLDTGVRVTIPPLILSLSKDHREHVEGPHLPVIALPHRIATLRSQ